MSNENDSAQLDTLVGFFLDFARKLLAQAESFVAAGGMPKRVESLFEFKAPEFSGSAAAASIVSFRQVQKPDFSGLILVNREHGL